MPPNNQPTNQQQTLPPLQMQAPAMGAGPAPNATYAPRTRAIADADLAEVAVLVGTMTCSVLVWQACGNA